MIVTLFSLVVAALWWFLSQGKTLLQEGLGEGFLFFSVVSFLALLFFERDRAEKQPTPLKKWLYLFPFLFFSLSLFYLAELMPPQPFVIPASLIAAALFFDLFRSQYRLKEPFERLKKELNQPTSFGAWQQAVDGTAEQVAKGIEESGFIQIQKGLTLFQGLYENLQPKEKKELYYLYPLEMLEMLQDISIHTHETIVSQKIFSTFAKMGLDLLEREPQMAPVALTKLGMGIKKCADMGDEELVLKGSLTLQQAAIASLDLKGWRDFFIQAVLLLEQQTESTFQKDKTQNIAPLLTPFVELADALEKEPTRSLPDYPLAKREVDRVIDKFRTVEQMLRQMPRIEEEVTSS